MYSGRFAIRQAPIQADRDTVRIPYTIILSTSKIIRKACIGFDSLEILPKIEEEKTEHS